MKGPKKGLGGVGRFRLQGLGVFPEARGRGEEEGAIKSPKILGTQRTLFISLQIKSCSSQP